MYLPLKRAWSFIWTTLHLNMFRIGPVVVKKIFRCRRCIFAISISSLLRNERGPSFEQSSSLINALSQVSGEEDEIWKVYGRTNRQTTYNNWSEKITWASSLGEIKTQQDLQVLALIYWFYVPCTSVRFRYSVKYSICRCPWKKIL